MKRYIFIITAIIIMPFAGYGDEHKSPSPCGSTSSPVNYDVTIETCTTIIKSNHQTPENLAMAYNTRGEAYISKELYNKALVDFNEAILLKPDFAEAYKNIGDDYYFDKLQYDKAITAYSKAIDLNPNYADVYFGRAIMYFRKRLYDKAVVDVNEAIRLNTTFSAAYNLRGLVKHAQCSEKSCLNRDNGKADFAKAKELGFDYSGQ